MSSTQPTTNSTAINQMMIHSMRTLQAQHGTAQHMEGGVSYRNGSTAINQMMIHSMRTLQAQHGTAQHTAHGRGFELQERLNSNQPDDDPLNAHTASTARHSTSQHTAHGRGLSYRNGSTAFNQMMIHSMRTLQAKHGTARHSTSHSTWKGV
jgi:methyltransferase-like protein